MLSGQHAVTVMAFVTYVLIAAKSAGLSVAATQSMVALSLIGMALCTGLQAYGGRWGSGSLLAHMPNPFMVPFATAAVAAGGPAAIFGVGLLSSLTALFVGSVIPRLRALFPPTVAGTVVSMGGLALVEPTVRHSLEINDQMQIDPVSALIAGSTLACIVAFSIWGTRQSRLLGLVMGIVIGLVVAAMAGHLHGIDALASTPFLAIPDFHAPQWNLSPHMAVAIVMVAMLTQLDTLGSVIIMDRMDNADWRRADMKAVGRGIRANGLGDLVGSFIGSFPTFTSSANIALTHATRSTSRWIGLSTAAMLLLVAFMPQATLALTLIPAPVLGAVELYAAAFLIVSGVELIASRSMDSRGIFMVGLSVCAGLTVMLMPGLALHAPEALQVLLGNGFIVTGVTAVLLNLVFRLGTRQALEVKLDGSLGDLSQQITDFVEIQGAAWAARRDVVHRAALAALEAAEAITASGNRQVTGILGSFDEFNFELALRHTGEPLFLDALAHHAPHDAEALWEADAEALEAAMQRVSGVLLRHLADRVSGEAASGGNAATLHLHFEH
jgi:xanthine permease XanP